MEGLTQMDKANTYNLYKAGEGEKYLLLSQVMAISGNC